VTGEAVTTYLSVQDIAARATAVGQRMDPRTMVSYVRQGYAPPHAVEIGLSAPTKGWSPDLIDQWLQQRALRAEARTARHQAKEAREVGKKALAARRETKAERAEDQVKALHAVVHAPVEPQRFLSVKDICDRFAITTGGFQRLRRPPATQRQTSYVPAPDVEVGMTHARPVQGWSAETVERWEAERAARRSSWSVEARAQWEAERSKTRAAQTEKRVKQA
jgi:hypothetical protein